MNKAQFQEIARQAPKEENLSWTVTKVGLNPKNPEEWEIYYDAWGRKYHKLLFRLVEHSGSTSALIKAELRGYIRQLIQNSRF